MSTETLTVPKHIDEAPTPDGCAQPSLWANRPPKEIPLTRGKVALVDAEDYEWLSQFNWYAAQLRPGLFYAMRNDYVGGTSRSVYLHRLVMRAKRGQYVDHTNGDGLDNRRENLRFCTNAQNLQNQHRTSGSSPYKGVSWSKRARKWTAQIKANRLIHLGYFNSEKKAALAYDEAARRLFAEFARPNFPETA